MYVAPHSTTSSVPTDDAAPASAAPTASTTRPITTGLLTQVNNMYSTLEKLECDSIDALVILFDYLNTGSHEGYAAALRAAGSKTKPAPVSSGSASRSGGAAAPAASLVPQARGTRGAQGVAQGATQGVTQGLWPPRSWPEKVMSCKDGGAHVKLKLAMQDSNFRNFEGGFNRGHRQLPAGCLEYIPMAGRGSGDHPRRWFTDVLEPAMRNLEPNQTLLVSPPNAHALLIGVDSDGQRFGLAKNSNNSRTDYLLTGERLDFALASVRFASSITSTPWAMLSPRGCST